MIEFKKITEDNYKECFALKISDEQDDFVASNMYTAAEAYVALTNDGGFTPMLYTIYDDDNMIGFIALAYCNGFRNRKEPYYDFYRFMIDKKYQKKGYGRKSLEKAIELIRTFPYGKAEILETSYNPKNSVAKKLYESLGFVETGDVNEANETIAVLKL